MKFVHILVFTFFSVYFKILYCETLGGIMVWLNMIKLSYFIT